MTLLSRASVSQKPSKKLDPDYEGVTAGSVTVLLPLESLPAGRPAPRVSTVWLFVSVIGLTFILRIFYAGHLYEDDGMWFTAAEQILRGKALYREIYFDKPPLLPLTYAFAFKCFGAHILTIRLFTIVYASAISGILFWIGSNIYDRRTGALAALLFAYFSTTYGAGHMQGLNTDFLMVVPYTVAAYLFLRSEETRFRRAALSRTALWYGFAGGILSGIACQINPKGLFALMFFGLALVCSGRFRRFARAESRSLLVYHRKDYLRKANSTAGVILFFISCVGALLGSAPCLIYIARSGSLSYYWTYVWLWGFKYSNYYPLTKVLKRGLWTTAGYFALNGTFAIALFVVIASLGRQGFKRLRTEGGGVLNSPAGAVVIDRESSRSRLYDLGLLLWLAVSFLALSLGGRFFPHYFFQVLPCLCLIGGRGLLLMARWFLSSRVDSRVRLWRRAVAPVMAASLIVTLVRYHSRTFWLASDWMRGYKSVATKTWYHEIRNREERQAAAIVKDASDSAKVDDVALEAIRAIPTEPDAAGADSRRLFVWGYRPWIYYWSGLTPASKYLSAQPLTGVPAGSEYDSGSIAPVLSAGETANARAELVRELEQTRPRYIIDEWGMYNPSLGIKAYYETREFMTSYMPVGAAGNLMIYRKRPGTGDEDPQKAPAH